MKKQQKIVSSRTGRFFQLGQLASGIAGGILLESTKQLAKGNKPSLQASLFTQSNMQRLKNKLSQMRGAAMKVGQLISMDTGVLLPKELADILGSLRDDAHIMPLGDIAKVMKAELGEDWSDHFKSFNFTPIASASIGQVHDAELKSGERVAIKIQYPGVAESIDSDVDNVATLLRISGLLPKGLDLEPLLLEAKQQLHRETDYSIEAESLNRFANLVKDDHFYQIPTVISEFSSKKVLMMEFLNGTAIGDLFENASENNAIARALLELSFRETFIWGFVQTDPNYSNYLYSFDTRRLQLLDFGAARDYPLDTVKSLRKLITASLDSDKSLIHECANELGYLSEDDPLQYQQSMVELLMLVTEPLRHEGEYNFATSDVAERVKEHVIQLRIQLNFTRIPPPPILFLHRKLGGLYLTLNRLRARLNVSEIWFQIM